MVVEKNVAGAPSPQGETRQPAALQYINVSRGSKPGAYLFTAQFNTGAVGQVFQHGDPPEKIIELLEGLVQQITEQGGNNAEP